jgi:hypothetical protein
MPEEQSMTTIERSGDKLSGGASMIAEVHEA